MKKIISIYLLVSFMLLTLLGCTEKTTQEESFDGSKGVFYEVNHNGTTVYLFGSIHIGNDNMYPLDSSIEDAFNRSNYLAVEVNINDMNFNEMSELVSEVGMYHDGSKLSDHIDSHLYEELKALLKQKGIDENSLSSYKPMFISDMVEYFILENHGYSLDLGIDQYFLTKAAKTNKTILELETLQDQLSLMTILGPESQEKVLHSKIFEKEKNVELVNEIVEKWIAGDINGLAAFRKNEEDGEDFNEYFLALTDDRDLKMAEKINGYLQNGDNETYFIVVGSLHLVGNNNIAELLINKGYEVKLVH